jgi:hypothetical protein
MGCIAVKPKANIAPKTKMKPIDTLELVSDVPCCCTSSNGECDNQARCGTQEHLTATKHIVQACSSSREDIALDRVHDIKEELRVRRFDTDVSCKQRKIVRDNAAFMLAGDATTDCEA